MPVHALGRYQLVRELGAGGMGVVWEARDPELGRGVAVKLLRERGGGRLAERLRREAKALARVVHPNVVAVHDVGVADGEVYIVMQLVTGTTLSDAKGRSFATRLALLEQAGRGLAAAHEAGIIHRDFKPSNVLVDDGSVARVSDFGLSRASEDAPVEVSGELGPGVTRADLVGTPAYMAPEQFTKGAVTAASDQFSFCITAWEVLCGERPYAGRDVDTLRAAVLAGTRKEPPSGLPRRIRRALERGLATDPADRFPSMPALLAALAPPRRGRWIAAGAGVVAVAAGIAVFATRDASDPCADAAAPASVVWSPARAEAVRAALAARDPAVAGEIVTRFGLRTTRWKAARIDACRATRVRDEQSADVLAQREACLDRSLADERAAIDMLAEPADAERVARASSIARGGLDPDDCGRATAAAHARRAVPPNLDADVARGLALVNAGRYPEAIALGPSLAARIAAAGDPSLDARWSWSLSVAYGGMGEFAPGRTQARRAAEAATVVGDDIGAARDWASVVEDAAAAGELKGIDDVMAMARAAATRSAQPKATAYVDIASGRIETQRGNYAEAARICKAVADRPEVGDDLRYDALGCAYDAQMHDGADHEDALALARTSHALSVQLNGADHPHTLDSERAIAGALSTLGDPTAGPAMDKVVARYDALYGDSIALMQVLRDRALADTPAGSETTPVAVAAIRRAAKIAEAKLPDGDPQRAQIFETLGLVEDAAHHPAEVDAAYARAIAAYEKLDDPLALARALFDYGETLKNRDDCTHAVPMLRRATDLAAKTGQSARIGSAALGALGHCLFVTKDAAGAEAALTQAIAQHDKDDDYLFGAQDRWELADQLIMRGDKARGLTVARDAVKELAGKPPPAPDLGAQIADWIVEKSK